MPFRQNKPWCRSVVAIIRYSHRRHQYGLSAISYVNSANAKLRSRHDSYAFRLRESIGNSADDLPIALMMICHRYGDSARPIYLPLL